MWQGFLLAILTGFTWTAIGVVLSRCAKKSFDVVAYSLAQTFFGILFTALCYIRFGEIVWRELLILLVLVGTGGVINSIAQMVVRQAMSRGNHGPVWAISQAALVIPFLAGVVLWGNTGSVGQWLGTGLIAGGILIPVAEQFRSQRNVLLPTLVAFLLFGLVQTLYAAPSQIPDFHDSAGLRSTLVSLGGFAGWCLVMSSRRERPAWNRPTLGLALFMALLSLVSLKIFFLGLDQLSRAGLGNVGIPLIVGANILGFAFYSRVVLRERPSKPETAGSAMVLAGIVATAF